MLESDIPFITAALAEAELAHDLNEVPVGAVVIKNNHIIGRGHNIREGKNKVMGHAEIMAIEHACDAIGDWRLEDCTLYCTLEPCPMCAGAIIQSRIKRVVFGAPDKKWGAAGTILNLFDIPFNHKVESHYHPDERCSEILTTFFKQSRLLKQI